MKNEGITQGPLFAVQDTAGAWCVTVGNSRFDQQVAYVGTDNRHIETGSAKGNAQLFAAAPELLEALSLMYCAGFWSADKLKDMPEYQRNAIETARAAISKAEGRA